MYDLKILVNGNPIRKYFDRDGRTWVEAKEGSRFDLKLQNNSYGRKLVIVSVDGLNIINGKHENPETARGYIVNGSSSITIPGWKTGPDSVREFIFTTGENSYSKKIGADERNIGVIAAVFIEEMITLIWSYTYPQPIRYYDPPLWSTTTTASTYRSSDNVYSANANDIHYKGGLGEASVEVMSCSAGETSSVLLSDTPFQEKKMAVGSGASVEYRTHNVNFNRGPVVSNIVIYYDSWEGLKRRGILLEDKNYREYPKPFPNGEYCPDY